jgi:hypothetical protein
MVQYVDKKYSDEEIPWQFALYEDNLLFEMKSVEVKWTVNFHGSKLYFIKNVNSNP